MPGLPAWPVPPEVVLMPKAADAEFCWLPDALVPLAAGTAWVWGVLCLAEGEAPSNGVSAAALGVPKTAANSRGRGRLDWSAALVSELAACWEPALKLLCWLAGTMDGGAVQGKVGAMGASTPWLAGELPTVLALAWGLAMKLKGLLLTLLVAAANGEPAALLRELGENPAANPCGKGTACS